MNSVEEAKKVLSERLNAKLRNGLSGHEFCDIHEKWAKSADNCVVLDDGRSVRMHEGFAYAYYVGGA